VDGVIRGIGALDALPMDPAGLLAVDRVTGPGGHEVDLAAETVCAPCRLLAVGGGGHRTTTAPDGARAALSSLSSAQVALAA
jgi:hypothetical protein